MRSPGKISAAGDSMASGSPFVSFNVDRDVTVYVGYDSRNALPAWLQSWQNTGQSLTTGAQMVASGAHDHALVIGADVMSSIIDYKDRATCVLSQPPFGVPVS